MPGCWVHFLSGNAEDRKRIAQAEKDRKAAKPPKPWPAMWDSQIEAVYPYTRGGKLLYEVVRRRGKVFTPRHQNGAGDWFVGYGFRDPQHHTTIFRYEEVRAALAAGAPVYVCEGEKDVLAIEEAGAVGTTMPGGAGMGWQIHHAEMIAEVASQSPIFVVADLDSDGLKQAAKVEIELRRAGVNSGRVQLFKPRTGKDVADHLGFGLGLEDFVPLGDDELDAYRPEESAIAKAFDRTSISAWIAEDGALVVPEPRKWIIPNFLPLGISGLVVAKGGTGKSFFGLSLALSLALAVEFGPFEVPEEAGIILASKEEDYGEMQRRLFFSAVARWGPGHRFSPLQAAALERCIHPVDLLGLRGAQLGEDLVAHLAALCSRFPGVRLIILDPIGKFLPDSAPELNSQEGAGFVHDWISRIVRETGCTVLADHHIRKQSSEGKAQLDSTAATGSQQLVDYARWALNLMRLDPEAVRKYGLDPARGPYVVAAVSKTNYSAPLQTPLVLRSGDGGGLVPMTIELGGDVDADRVLDVMRQLGPEAAISRDEMRALARDTHGMAKHEVDRARSALIDAGSLVVVRRPNDTGRGTRLVFALAGAAKPSTLPEPEEEPAEDRDGDDALDYWQR